MMGEGTVNDEELVEVIAEGSAGDIWPVLSERERRFQLKAAEKALAALRSAGFQVFKPEDCEVIDYMAGTYFLVPDDLVPAESPKGEPK